MNSKQCSSPPISPSLLMLSQGTGRAKKEGTVGVEKSSCWQSSIIPGEKQIHLDRKESNYRLEGLLEPLTQRDSHQAMQMRVQILFKKQNQKKAIISCFPCGKYSHWSCRWRWKESTA